MSPFEHYSLYLKKQVTVGIIPATSCRTIIYSLTRPIRSESIVWTDPERLVAFLNRTVSKRTLCNTFSHMIVYADWLLENGYKTGENPFRKFRRKMDKKSLFKCNREPRIPTISFEETESRIVNEMENREATLKALQLLYTGMRYAESFTYEAGFCLGKGGKKRQVFPIKAVLVANYTKHYDTFRRQLAAIGLKPHDLRKIYATEQSRQGKSVYQLRRLLGHSSIMTSQFYVGA